MATRTVGNLKIQLDVNNKRFQAKMTESTKTVKKFETVTGGAKRVLGSIGRVTKGLAVGVAGATVGMGYLVNKSFDTLDALAKTSDKLGITTEGLQALRMAAKLTGVETGTLDMALQRMTRRVSEAATGTEAVAEALRYFNVNAEWFESLSEENKKIFLAQLLEAIPNQADKMRLSMRLAANGAGEAVAALKELGLSAQDLVKLTPDQQFLKIAAAMKKIPNSADRVRLAMRLFDSEGVALVNTLGLGADGIREIGNRMAGFGGLFGRDMLRGVEAMRDALTWTWEILGSIINRIAIGLAPWIEGIAARFNMWLEHGGVNWILGAIEQTAWWLHNAFLIIKDELLPEFNKLKDTAQDYFNNTNADDLNDGLVRMVESLKSVETFILKIQNGWAHFVNLTKVGMINLLRFSAWIDKKLGFDEDAEFAENMIKSLEDEVFKSLDKIDERNARITAEVVPRAVERANPGLTEFLRPTPQAQAQAPVMRMTGPDGEMIVYDPNTERTANALENVLQNGLPLAVN